MSDVAVRTARPADADAVGAVQSEVWRDSFAAVLDPELLAQLDPQRFAEAWLASLTAPPSPRHRLLVATEGEQVIGFAAMVPDADDPRLAQLVELDVRPEARRRGHGSRLLNAAVDTLRANDFTTVHTWLLAEDEATRAFLEASGFAPDGAWRDRIVSEGGNTAREVRLLAAIDDAEVHDGRQ